MARLLLLFALWIGLLAAMAWATDQFVARGLRDWFMGDVDRRAESIVAGARAELRRHWEASDHRALTRLLQTIARDERVMAAAACGDDDLPVAMTELYPAQDFGCGILGRRRSEAQHTQGYYSTVVELPSGLIHVSTLRVAPRDGNVEASGFRGFLVLIHDLSFIGRRELQARQLLLGAFAVVGLVATVLTLVFLRIARRGWLRQLRRVLVGGERRGDFVPILRDVQELTQRLLKEREGEAHGGRWTPQRLKSVLSEHLRDERVIILANREPYIHDRASDGTIRVLHPASGLVTALEPVMRACGGVWVAHGAGSADRATVDANNRVRVPPDEESYWIRRVWMTEQEERGYYYGFANEGLWPLSHLAYTRPMFRAEDWAHYRAMNERFADAVVAETERDDPIVLVQDYHFALAPQMIRARLPRATIITFWHIPWPNADRFGVCPWRQEILQGLLGSSIMGFHTQQHCNNFIDAVDRYLESRIDREQHAVFQGQRRTLVRPYPISIEWPVHWLQDLPSVDECRASVLRELRLPDDTILGLGIDRLDYTKGIEERLLAVERLLERRPDLVGRFVFAQLAAPSRTKIARYQELNENVEALAARINAKHARTGYTPIVLLRAHHEPVTVFRYYRAANVCYVSSLDDGMNLVAKEYVAARDDDRGVLVLSQFTGAARELTEALVVNPYDLEQASSALSAAIDMRGEEQRDRMRAMRALVSQLNVYRWAGRMLVDAAQLRTREQLWGRWKRDATEAPARS